MNILNRKVRSSVFSYSSIRSHTPWKSYPLDPPLQYRLTLITIYIVLRGPILVAITHSSFDAITPTSIRVTFSSTTFCKREQSPLPLTVVSAIVGGIQILRTCVVIGIAVLIGADFLKIYNKELN